MSAYHHKIGKMLANTRATPEMYAISVEAMLMRVSTLLEVAGVEFKVQEFYCKHGGKYGSGYLLQVPVGVTFGDWARTVCDDGLQMLERHVLKTVNIHDWWVRASYQW